MSDCCNTPQRKNMRLENYDYSQNGMYFITICTENRRKILGSIVGDGSSVPQLKHSEFGIVAEDYIHQIPLRYEIIRVTKYAIMPNHVHLILTIDTLSRAGAENPPPTIGSVIAWYKYQTTKRYNSESNGAFIRVWQRSYYDHIIRSEQDYLNIWSYVDNNPAKWADDEYFENH